MKKYELLMFDMDGTIFNYKGAESTALKGAFEAFSLECNEDIKALYRKINDRIWVLFENGGISAVELRTRRFEEMFAEIGVEVDAAEFSKTYLEKLAETKDLIPGAWDVLRKLRPHFRISLISNGLIDVQYHRLKAAGMDSLFDAVGVSEEAGRPKPAPDLFELVFERAGHTDKSTAIIIGDNLNSDIGGGINFGIDTCWCNFRGKTNDTPHKPDFTITSLLELPPLLMNESGV